MTDDRTTGVVADVVRGALDDCRIRLGPRTERAFIERVAELLDVAGYRLRLDADTDQS